MSETLPRATLTGGTGNDTFVMNDDVPSGANLSASAYSIVTDFGKGDALQLFAANFEVSSNIELEHVQLSVTGFDYVDGSDMVVGA